MRELCKIPFSLIVDAMIKEKLKSTLLGIGPMSENSIRAALELANEMDFPLMLIASRNQIEAEALGGGYVFCRTPFGFYTTVLTLADEIGFAGAVFLCRDHGGPWQRDEEYRAKIPEREAMRFAKQSYLDDIMNGFRILHIDPTRDPHNPSPLPPDLVIQRTIELIEFIESERAVRGIGTLSYEIGTDEISGWLTSAEAFDGFLTNLNRELTLKGLPRPAFIVGQTGTLVKMHWNHGSTDIPGARALSKIALSHQVLFKEHNADYLAEDCLSHHPAAGISASNVAPEFGCAETDALLCLSAWEEKAMADSRLSPRKFSRFAATLREDVASRKKWRKWLAPEDAHRADDEVIADAHLFSAVTRVCGHYSFDSPAVSEARSALYANVKELGAAREPERMVLASIKKAMGKYVKHFKLEGFGSRVWGGTPRA